MYKFNVMHMPGVKHKGPDAASRYPGTRLTGMSDTEEMEAVYSSTVVRRWQMPEFRTVSWEDVQEKAVTDDICVRLNAKIAGGFPENRADLEDDLKPFWPLRDNLYTLDDVVMMKDRMFVPTRLREEVLECFRSAHQGERNIFKYEVCS